MVNHVGYFFLFWWYSVHKFGKSIVCHEQSPESLYFYGWPKPSPNGRYMSLCLRDVGAKTRIHPLLVQVEKRRVSSRTFGSLPGVDWTCQDIKLQWNYTGISHLWLLVFPCISPYVLIWWYHIISCPRLKLEASGKHLELHPIHSDLWPWLTALKFEPHGLKMPRNYQSHAILLEISPAVDWLIDLKCSWIFNINGWLDRLW